MAVLGWQNYYNYSPHLFMDITSFGGIYENTTIRGLVKDHNVAHTQTWNSPLEGLSADNKYSTTAGILQAGEIEKLFRDNPLFKGRTLISLQQSTQVWQGAEPLSITATLLFKGYRLNTFEDEVENAIKALHLWASPELNAGVALSTLSALVGDTEQIQNISGEVPFDINVSFMNRSFNAVYKIESVNENQETAKIHKNGNRIEQEVSVTFGSKRALSRNTAGTDFKPMN